MKGNSVFRNPENLYDYFYYLRFFSKNDDIYKAYLGLLVIICEKFALLKTVKRVNFENQIQFTDITWISLNILSYCVNGNNWNNAYFYQMFCMDNLNMKIINRNLVETFLKNLEEMNQLFDEKVNTLLPKMGFWEDFLERENSSCFI